MIIFTIAAITATTTIIVSLHGSKGRGGGFHDSRFYEREFGLYDEDEQINTMTSRDFWHVNLHAGPPTCCARGLS